MRNLLYIVMSPAITPPTRRTKPIGLWPTRLDSALVGAVTRTTVPSTIDTLLKTMSLVQVSIQREDINRTSQIDAKTYKLVLLIRCLDFLHRLRQVGKTAFGVAVKHAGDRFEEQRVFQPGEPFALTAFEHHYGLGPVHPDDGHAGNGALGMVPRLGVDHTMKPGQHCTARSRDSGAQQ